MLSWLNDDPELVGYIIRLMEISELPQALNAPDNQAVQLGLSRILTVTGLRPADLVPVLYDPGNREVLDQVRAGTSADTITRTWERLHPSDNPQKTTEPAEPEPTSAPAPALSPPPAPEAPGARFMTTPPPATAFEVSTVTPAAPAPAPAPSPHGPSVESVLESMLEMKVKDALGAVVKLLGKL